MRTACWGLTSQVEPCLAVFLGVPSWSQGEDEPVAWYAEKASRRDFGHNPSISFPPMHI